MQRQGSSRFSTATPESLFVLNVVQEVSIMLPDFPKVKARLETMLKYEMELARLHMGPLAAIRESVVFEGNKITIIREDGSVDEMGFEEITAELQVNFAEVETMTHEMVLDKINRPAKEIEEKKAKFAYEQIGKAAEEAGNVVSADGKPFSIEMLFEMLEKMDLDFDEAGNPSGTMFVAHPKLFPAIAKAISQAEAYPETAKRYQELMDQKREEWRVRENNRKLVG